MAALQLARRSDTSKCVEILLLRHQLTIAQRQLGQSRLRMSWADRALIALLLSLSLGPGIPG
jgi:putative transposase